MSTIALGAGCAVAAYAAFAVLSVVLAIIDARTHRLPDRLVLPAYPIAGLALIASSLLLDDVVRLVSVIGGGAALFVLYLLLGMLRPGAVGGGDVKLAGLIGAFLGFLGWEALVLGAALGFVLGGLQGVVLMALRRARGTTRIAFGPAMLAGAWLVIVATAWWGS